MVEDARGRIDYDECGTGPTVVLVPGSCSTGAAWRPVIAAWNNRFRCVTTSLLGYGGTAERRTASNPSISHEAEVLEAVVRRAGGRVHLVGHSFGGLVALAVALRKQVPLASLVIVEAPAAEILRDAREHQHYRAFRRMTESYFAAFEGGNAGSDRRDDRLLRRRRHLCFLAAAGPCLRRSDDAGSTSSIGRVPMVFRCRRHRWLPSTSPSSSSAAGQVIRRCNVPMRSSVNACAARLLPRSTGPRTS